MKTLLALIILTLTTFGCTNKVTSKDDKISESETQDKTDLIFKYVANFPTIKDTTKFITSLRQILKNEVDLSSLQNTNERITTYKKVKIYGSDNEYFFIEYDYRNGCGAAFPWKYQILITAEGKLVKILSGQRFEFVEIFKNENPFLLSTTTTSKGNGGHELYKFSADTLENVYEGYFDNAVRTYDAHEDNRIYEPKELTLKIKDYNNDSFNDIAFVGKIVLIQGQTENGDWYDSETINGKNITYSLDNPFKKIPVEFVFLYEKQTGHFKSIENYTEKYGLDK